MTSRLEKYLSKELYTRFGHLSIRQNYRPTWMDGLELDFFIEDLNIAAEVQGAQHYQFVEYFHKSQDDFEKQKDRDAKKVLICRERKIKLVEIFTEKDADLFILKVKEMDKSKTPKYYYHEEYKGEKSSSRVGRQRMAMAIMIKKLVKKFKNANHINAKLDIAAKAIRSSTIHNVEIPYEIDVFIKQNYDEVNKRVA